MFHKSFTALLIVGVWAVATQLGVGGNAAPARISTSVTSLVKAHGPAGAFLDTIEFRLPPVLAVLLTVPSASPAPPVPCAASPRKAMPGRDTEETITVHTTRGAGVNLVVHYPTRTRSFTIVADSAGTAVITFSISPSMPGYPVWVDVSTNSGQVCGTQFTPQ